MSKETKVKIISLSLEPEMHDMIKDSAKKLGHKNVSQLFRDLVSKYLGLMVNESDDIPVIIRIPGDLRDNPEKIREWLRFKADAIADALERP
jgi:hypothetical protein